MMRRGEQRKNNDEKENRKNRVNAWKRFGAIAVAAVLFAGTASIGARTDSATASAKNSSASETETEKRVSLNIVDSQKTSADSDGEEETEKHVSLNIVDSAKQDTEEETQEAAETETETPAETETAAETEAETEEETEKRVSLNIVDSGSPDEEDTEAAQEAQTGEETTEAETGEEPAEAQTEEEPAEAGTEEAVTEEAQETYETIPSVESGSGSIVTTDVSAIVENCMPSIVAINNKSVEEVETYYYGTQEEEEESTASGIIIAQNDEELLIATNSHVVSGATELSVCFTVDTDDVDELVVPAKIKGTDKSYELAVVAVQLSDISDNVMSQLKIAKLGSSDDLKVGQAAIAIGNALGYGQSVTCGIISALNRSVTIDDFSMEVILTDAAINMGNSGGALLNANGEVIGINVAKEVGDSTEGMGYSIPIDTAIPVLEKLVNKETRDALDDATRGYLGATVLSVSEDAMTLYNMPQGAFVYEVAEGSAAEKAGIKKGDVITKFDGETVTGASELVEKMNYYAVGETVTVEVQTATNGVYEAREVEVTLQQGSEEQIASAQQNNSSDDSSDGSSDEDSSAQDDDSSQNGSSDSYDGSYGFSDGFEDYNSQFGF